MPNDHEYIEDRNIASRISLEFWAIMCVSYDGNSELFNGEKDTIENAISWAKDECFDNGVLS